MSHNPHSTVHHLNLPRFVLAPDLVLTFKPNLGYPDKPWQTAHGLVVATHLANPRNHPSLWWFELDSRFYLPDRCEVLDGNYLGRWLYKELQPLLPRNLILKEFGFFNRLKMGGSDQGHYAPGVRWPERTSCMAQVTRQNSHPWDAVHGTADPIISPIILVDSSDA